MKIFCIGRNYINHAKELNNKVPEKPLFFMKPPTALLKDNKAFYYPEFSKNIHYEVEIVVKICKNGKHIQKEFAHNYYDQIGLGIDFTARDIQSECKKNGHPWEIAKAFNNSAVISKFKAIKQSKKLSNTNFSLYKNGELVQNGNTQDMVFPLEEIIPYISKYITIQFGDLIYTGTPAGVGAVEIGDLLEGYIEKEQFFECKIK